MLWLFIPLDLSFCIINVSFSPMKHGSYLSHFNDLGNDNGLSTSCKRLVYVKIRLYRPLLSYAIREKIEFT